MIGNEFEQKGKFYEETIIRIVFSSSNPIHTRQELRRLPIYYMFALLNRSRIIYILKVWLKSPKAVTARQKLNNLGDY